MILVYLFIIGAVILLSLCTFWLIMTGNFKWDDGIRDNTFFFWRIGLTAVIALDIWFFGIPAVILAWPVWLTLGGMFVLVIGLMDFLFGAGWFRRNKPERTITHADGRKAVVDGASKGYKRIVS